MLSIVFPKKQKTNNWNQRDPQTKMNLAIKGLNLNSRMEKQRKWRGFSSSFRSRRRSKRNSRVRGNSQNKKQSKDRKILQFWGWSISHTTRRNNKGCKVRYDNRRDRVGKMCKMFRSKFRTWKIMSSRWQGTTVDRERYKEHGSKNKEWQLFQGSSSNTWQKEIKKSMWWMQYRVSK